MMISNMTSSGERNWIYIVSSAYASLPSPGNRVSPSDAANMPKIVSPDSAAAISGVFGTHHYRFVGIEVTSAVDNFALIVFGKDGSGNNATTLSQLPTDITFDRCYIHGTATNNFRKGIYLNANRAAVIDSYLSDFHENGFDTQAINSIFGAGPFKVVNNYLEAAGENMLFGGGDPPITNLVPSDIEIRRNYMFKPLSWIGSVWTVKNILEFKNAQRVIAEGNVLENNWAMAQDGNALVVTVRNQDGFAPWSTVRNITYRLNRVINVGQGYDITGHDTNNPSQQTLRVLIENNTWDVKTNQGAGASIGLFLGGPQQVTVRHNTGFTPTGAATALAFSDNTPKADIFDFRDNIFSEGDAGFAGTGTTEGNSTLATWFTNYTFTKNVIIGTDQTSIYPALTYFPATPADVGFTDYAGGNYKLTASSPYHNAASDGTDIGADIDSLNAATLHTVNGQWGSEPPTYSTPSGTITDMPTTFLDTTYRPQSGARLAAHTAAEYQAALNSAQLGDTIVLDAGATYSGHFSLPAK